MEMENQMHDQDNGQEEENHTHKTPDEQYNWWANSTAATTQDLRAGTREGEDATMVMQPAQGCRAQVQRPQRHCAPSSSSAMARG